MSTTSDNAARAGGLTISAHLTTIEPAPPVLDDGDPFATSARRVVRQLGQLDLPAGAALDRVELRAGEFNLLSVGLGPDTGPDWDEPRPRPSTSWGDDLSVFEWFLLGEVAYLAGGLLGDGVRALWRRLSR